MAGNGKRGRPDRADLHAWTLLKYIERHPMQSTYSIAPANRVEVHNAASRIGELKLMGLVRVAGTNPNPVTKHDSEQYRTTNIGRALVEHDDQESFSYLNRARTRVEKADNLINLRRARRHRITLHLAHIAFVLGLGAEDEEEPDDPYASLGGIGPDS